MRRLLISALLLCSAPVSAQHLAPEDYIFPLRDVAGLYSANFGEMRPNHFHSGIDIKTDGVTGKPVLATADGYISRIAVTPGGYGRAIYITHPNGTTSVYGHLSKFRDDIEKYVHEERYRTRRNSINLYPSADRFPLKQGEQFAWSGNTGSSAGPHLHFEIRDSRTQRTLNTISSGVIRTRDDIPPRLVKLYYVEVDSVRGVPVHARPRPVELVEKTPGRYALKQEGALSVGGRGYFILEATDRKNDVSNTFGLWRIREFADEDPIFELRIDGFAFDQTRYCNAVTHYPMQVASRNEVIRLTRLDGCIDDFYPVLKNQALLTPSEGQSQQIRIEAEDDSGNRSILEFRTIRQPAQRIFAPYAIRRLSSSITAGPSRIQQERHRFTSPPASSTNRSFSVSRAARPNSPPRRRSPSSLPSIRSSITTRLCIRRLRLRSGHMFLRTYNPTPPWVSSAKGRFPMPEENIKTAPSPFRPAHWATSAWWPTPFRHASSPASKPESRSERAASPSACETTSPA